MTTGKTIALTRWTFVGKVMPAFNVLSRCLDMLDSIIDLMDTNLSKLQEIVKDRGA